MSDVDVLIDRLKAACDGHPAAKVAWPHRLLHDAIEALEAHRKAESMGGWRPVTDVPLDTWVLVLDEDEYHVARKIDNGVKALWCGDHGVKQWLRPTAWMPLPAAPKGVG